MLNLICGFSNVGQEQTNDSNPAVSHACSPMNLPLENWARKRRMPPSFVFPLFTQAEQKGQYFDHINRLPEVPRGP